MSGYDPSKTREVALNFVVKHRDVPLPQAGRICRLLRLLSPEDFEAWMQRPNEQLDGRTPESLLSTHPEVIADLVDDMLTGQPT